MITRMELRGVEQQESLHHMLAADTSRPMLVMIVMTLMVKYVLCVLRKTSVLRRCLLLSIR